MAAIRFPAMITIVRAAVMLGAVTTSGGAKAEGLALLAEHDDGRHPGGVRHRYRRAGGQYACRPETPGAPNRSVAGGDRSCRVADPFTHDPAYRRPPCRPAISIASRLWQAVTPEPHMTATSAGDRPARAGA